MIRCLLCGREISDKSSVVERQTAWHIGCAKRFFNTDSLPVIDLDEKAIQTYITKTVEERVAIPGVQKKISLGFSIEDPKRLTVVDYPTGYILKPQTEDYEELPELEHLSMRMAEAAGIKTVPYALIDMRGSRAYITKRVDRVRKGSDTFSLAMEDFCQLSGKMTYHKYRGSYELCARLIRRYSSSEGLDLSELFMRVVFSFITGNSDMHLKNISLIEKERGSRKFILSPAYDILPVNVILPEDEDQLALTVNGKKRQLRKNDFLIFADSCGIMPKTAVKLIEKLCSLEDKFISECENSYVSNEWKEKLINLISERIKMLITG